MGFIKMQRYGDFSDAKLWTDTNLRNLRRCEEHWRDEHSAHIIKLIDKELKKRSEAHGNADV